MEQIEKWEDTKLLIVDEISFASKSDFELLDNKLRQLKQNPNKAYGGLHIVFAGDYHQLEPVGAIKRPVYNEPCVQLQDWLNCYMELEGMHRFKNDPEWGELLIRWRNEEITTHDIDKINERVVTNDTKLPHNIKYATYYNKDRDAINAGLFDTRCNLIQHNFNSTDDSIIIFSDHVLIKNSNKVFQPLINARKFWDECGEDDVKLPRGKGRMDPVLRLYKGIQVMLTQNIDVTAGLANGTQATVDCIALKPETQPTYVQINQNVKVKAVFASDVEYIQLRHTNKNIHPPTFQMTPTQMKFNAKFKVSALDKNKKNETKFVEMKATQVPIVVNNATTGHKLQGQGVESLFIHNWNYVTNWPYVMLSRVKTRKGLYLRQPLSKDLSKYKKPENLRKMIDAMKSKTPTEFTEHQYNTYFMS